MREQIDSVARFPSSDVLNQLQPMLPDHPAVLHIFVRDRIGCAQSESHLFFRRFSIGHTPELALDRPGKIHRRRPCRLELLRCVGYALIESRGCGTRCRLNCRQIHPKPRAYADQSRSANVHFPNCRRHLFNIVHFFDDETVRQKTLIDQLHDTFIVWLNPNRSKVSAAYIHRMRL